LRLLILVAREGFLKDKCGPRAKKFEHHCLKPLSLVGCASLKNTFYLQLLCCYSSEDKISLRWKGFVFYL